MSRLAVVLVVPAIVLAGCAAPQEEPEDPLFGICPQWEPGDEATAATVELAGDGDASQEVFGAGLLDQGGMDLDLVRFTIDSWSLAAGTVQVRAYSDSDDRQRPIRDYRAATPQMRPVLTLQAGAEPAGHEFDVHLSPVAGDHPTDPDTVRLAWSLQGAGPLEAEYTVSYHYRVCAAP